MLTTSAAWQTLDELIPVQSCKKGTILFEQGSPLLSAYYCSTGVVKLVCGSGGTRKAVGIRSARHFLSIPAPLEREIHGVSAIALTRVRLHAIEVGRLAALMDGSREISELVQNSMMADARERIAELVGFRELSPEARVRALIWRLLQIEHGEDCNQDRLLRLRLRLAEADIADLTLLSAPVVRSLLRQFSTADLVRRTNNTLLIPSPKALVYSPVSEQPPLAPKSSNRAIEVTLVRPDTSVSDERVAKAIGIVRLRFGDCELSIGSAAKEVNVSVWHLSRLFRDQMGCGFRTYLREFRIRFAQEMLNREDTIKEIAYAVGYRNVSDFNHHFKATTTVCPSDFRSALRIVSSSKS